MVTSTLASTWGVRRSHEARRPRCHHGDQRHAAEGGQRPCLSTSPRRASIRASIRFTTLERCPIQIGVASTRTSPARIVSRSNGQALASRGAVFTPGLMSWSRALTLDVSMSCLCNARRVEDLLAGAFLRTVLECAIRARSAPLGGCRIWRRAYAGSSVERDTSSSLAACHGLLKA